MVNPVSPGVDVDFIADDGIDGGLRLHNAGEPSKDGRRNAVGANTVKGIVHG